MPAVWIAPPDPLWPLEYAAEAARIVALDDAGFHSELERRFGLKLGDIAIAYHTMRREADREQKPFDHHLSHLAVHGFLHLIGYDHENDADAEAMESLETEILAQLGIPDPYADRDRMD